MRKHQAKETFTIDQALLNIHNKKKWISTIMDRLYPFMCKKESLKILDVGCAQGEALAALTELGHNAYGVEPYVPAVETAYALAGKLGYKFDIKHGRAEELPFEDDQFDIVIATSVMEHVKDIDLSLSEIYRVLKPDGVFWFNSASAMSPFQHEIAVFPLFGWYPDNIKRKIMNWAKNNKPELIGGTQTPAIHWWTKSKAINKLKQAGFIEVWDRWDIVNINNYHGMYKFGIYLAQRNKFFRFFADIIRPGCSFAGRK